MLYRIQGITTKKKIMKKVYLMLSCLALAFSCEDIDQINGDLASTQWLQFENATQSSGENEGAILVPVIYASEANDTDIDVSFTYTADATEGFTVEPANGIVTIPAGEFYGYITVTPVDDIIAGDNIVLDFSIEGNTDYNLGIAGDGVYNVHSIVTIVEDDCPIDLAADWVGNYSVVEGFTPGSTNEGITLASNFGEVYQLTLSADTSDATGTSAIWNNTAGFNSYFPNGTEMSFLTCSEQVAFTGGSTVIADFDVLVYATATFNPSSFSITGTGDLGDFGEYSYTLTKI